ncbi:TPA: hypothetical protein P2R04_001219 [Aeromonas veronii]|nr:hypothetical protein [Aeromonas veronii]
MRNRSSVMLFVIYSCFSSHASSATLHEVFSWSGKVPLSPSLAVTQSHMPEVVHNVSSLATLTFELSRLDAPLIYSVTLSKVTHRNTTYENQQVQNAINFEDLNGVKLLDDYSLITSAFNHTRIIRFQHIQHDVLTNSHRKDIKAQATIVVSTVI